MSARATTDNFLPYARGKSQYRPRPILRNPRHHRRRSLISDFLPPRSYPSKPQLAFAGSVAAAGLGATFGYQFVSDPPPKTRIRLRPRLSRRKLICAFAVSVLALVFSGSLMGSNHRMAGQANIPIGVMSASPAPSPKKAQASIALPARLEIPKINVDAALDYAGITSQGKLGVPEDPAKAAWYAQGPRPGERGNAVIDGHFGYRNHIPAVFDNLHSLQKGDRLYVKDMKGITSTFVVRELRIYGSDDYAPAIFRSGDGKAHLNLITCEGTWNRTQKSFSNRLVVFADETTK